MATGGIDLDALLAPQRWNGRLCTVVQALAEIGDEVTRTKVSAACDDPRVPSMNLETAFSNLLGDAPALGAIRRHQNRRTPEVANRCKCP